MALEHEANNRESFRKSTTRILRYNVKRKSSSKHGRREICAVEAGRIGGNEGACVRVAAEHARTCTELNRRQAR